MKNIIFYCGLFFFQYSLYGQSLIIKGKIKCQNESVNSTKGAEDVIIVPAFMPSRATVTTSHPSGYFECNTGMPISILQDKTVTVYVISRCTSCKEVAKHVFISEDQDRQNRDDAKEYVTIKDWMLNADCNKAELRPLTTDSLLNVIVKEPAQNLDKVASATALTGAPAFLNFINTLTNVVGLLPDANDFKIQSLSPGKIHYGEFLQASPFFHSANTGFNFSPSRDMSEAAFWNPSAISFSRKPINISLLTNIKNNVKLTGFYRINEKFSISAGGIYTTQDERRTGTFQGVPPLNMPSLTFTTDSLIMNLKEYAVLISPVYKINSKLSVGLTIKSVWQHFNIPDEVSINKVNSQGIGNFTDSSITKQYFNADISVTYKITNALQAGANLMNLAATKLFADAFVPGQSVIPMIKQRCFAIGLLYKWQRFNAGTDVLFTSDGLYDLSLGVNYVPFNNALISAGMTLKQLSYSFAFRIKYFRIAYINDNHWLINEKRKSGILNGGIYGGFIFDFN